MYYLVNLYFRVGNFDGEMNEWRGSSAWREHAITNRQVAGSKPAPATILLVKLAARC